MGDVESLSSVDDGMGSVETEIGTRGGGRRLLVAGEEEQSKGLTETAAKANDCEHDMVKLLGLIQIYNL